MKFFQILLTGALSVTLLTAASPIAFAAESAADVVSTDGLYVREVPPVSHTSAAFVTLLNGGTKDHALVAAASPAAKNVELHTHEMDKDGVHRMREMEQISLPAGETATLEPGGMHIMFIGLTAPLKAGDEVSLTLTYEDGSTQDLVAPVKSIQEGMKHSGGKCGNH
ncbi:MAG: copper chaperone PCu(A)C [Pseudomonadota bacterium]